jgi:hypothetical protein
MDRALDRWLDRKRRWRSTPWRAPRVGDIEATIRAKDGSAERLLRGHHQGDEGGIGEALADTAVASMTAP